MARQKSFLPTLLHVMVNFVAADSGKPPEPGDGNWSTVDPNPSQLIEGMRIGIDTAFTMTPDALANARGIRWLPRFSRYVAAKWQLGRFSPSRLHVWPGVGGLPKDIGTGTAEEVLENVQAAIEAGDGRVVNSKMANFLRFAAAHPAAARRLCLARPVIVQPAKLMHMPEYKGIPGALVLDDGGHRSVVAAFLGIPSLPGFYADEFDFTRPPPRFDSDTSAIDVIEASASSGRAKASEASLTS